MGNPKAKDLNIDGFPNFFRALLKNTVGPYSVDPAMTFFPRNGQPKDPGGRGASEVGSLPDPG